MLKLWDHQQKGVNDSRACFRDGFKSVLYVLPTGGGKTVVFCYMTKKSVSKNNRVLILVHRVGLLRQISRALTKFGVVHGLINPNYTQNKSAHVQVASIQTLLNRFKKFKKPDFIIVDEAHHATSPSFRKVFKMYPNAVVLGVTATPIRADGEALGSDSGGVFETMVVGPQISKLIELGYLVRPIIYAPKNKIDFSSVKITKGDFNLAAIARIMDKPAITSDVVDQHQDLCAKVPTIVFCVSISHSKHVAEAFRQRGYNAYSVNGKMDEREIFQILDGLGDGTVDVVTSCDIISEGTDIPIVGCTILLRPTKSLGLYLQQIGRGLRAADGKSKSIVLDHAGNVMRHGLPDENQKWSLNDSFIGYGEQYKGLKYGVIQCNKCLSLYKAISKCPICFPMSDPKNYDSGYKSLKELQELGKQKNYKPGWAKMVHKSHMKKII